MLWMMSEYIQGYQLLSGETANSFTFTIPNGYDHLFITLIQVVNEIRVIRLDFNGDTTAANYRGASATKGNNVVQTLQFANDIGSSAFSGNAHMGYHDIWLPYPKDASRLKRAVFTWGVERNMFTYAVLDHISATSLDTVVLRVSDPAYVFLEGTICELRGIKA